MFLQFKTLEYVIRFQLSNFQENYPWLLYYLWWDQVYIIVFIYLIIFYHTFWLNYFRMYAHLYVLNKANKISELHLFLIIRHFKLGK